MRIALLTVFLFYSLATFAQLCQGSLGENIFDRGSFSTGTEFVLPNDPGIAPGYDYSFVVPNDGEYTITNNTAALSGLYPTWLATGDNSSDDNGYFMVVNASFEPGLFYIEEVQGLCPNTLYEFSADIINLIQTTAVDHIRPNVEFLINGVVLDRSGDIPQNETWNSYGFTFTTGATDTTLTLSLRNNAPGGRGNDLGLDNISFRACGPSAFVGIASDETQFLCFDDAAREIIADISDPSRAIQWQSSPDRLAWTDIPGERGMTLLHDQFTPGDYYYRYLSAGTAVNLANRKCRVVSDVLHISVLPETFVVNDTICAGAVYPFGSGELDAAGYYEATMTSSKGCDSTTQLFLAVEPYVASTLELDLTDPSCPDTDDGTIAVTGATGGYGGQFWSLGGEQSMTYSNLAEGEYQLVVTDRFLCETLIDVTLSDPQDVSLTILGDTAYLFGDDVLLAGQVVPSDREIRWAVAGQPFCEECPSIDFVAVQDVSVVATTGDAACFYGDTISIVVAEPVLPEMPNAISPNGDRSNEVLPFRFYGKSVKEIDGFYLFDRWGNRVANAVNIPVSDDLVLWDGRMNGQPATAGLYSYVLTYRLADNRAVTTTGNITVIR